MPRLSQTLFLALALACAGDEVAPPAQAAPPPAAERAAAPAAAAPGPSGDAVVARYNDQTITMAEVEKAAAGAIIEARMSLYQAQRQGADLVLVERLLKLEADARGVTEEELVQAEVHAKVQVPTNEEIEAFFNENQGRMPAGLDQMRPQISGYLQQEAGAEAMRAFLDTLRDKANAQILLEPPRVEVSAGTSARHGSADAPVQIIEFSDFECPYCSKAAATVEEVKEKYGDKVSVVYRHFPLPMHDRAHMAAQASECANDQDGFWPYHDILFENTGRMQDEDLQRYAREAKLDGAAFDACLASGKHASTVDKDMEEGGAVGMSGTPGFYINGVMLSGAQPLEAFSEIIDGELTRAGIAL